MNKWIPITEKAPKPGQFVLVSFENRPFPDIARYEGDEEGGAFYFYSGCEEKSYLSYGIFVNAWMPLPKPYRPEDKSDGKKPAWGDRVLGDFMKNAVERQIKDTSI